MAFNSETLKFLAEKIEQSDYNNIDSQVKQLFNYLKTEVKDNPQYELYELESKKYDNWGNDDDYDGMDIGIPHTLEEAKLLSYSVYNRIYKGEISHAPSFATYKFGGTGFRESVDQLNNYLFDFLYAALEDIINANKEDIVNNNVIKVSGNTTFIIHGHDNLLKNETQNTLLKAGVSNIILHERPDNGRTIIEKLIEEGNSANFAVALLSPDDLSNLGNGRARQNVIFELGYFMGRLGKQRVRLIVRDDVEIPSDLQGILYSKYDELGKWKVDLIKEMIHVGISADIKSVL